MRWIIERQSTQRRLPSEAVRRLEAVADGAIHTDVGNPDQRQQQNRRCAAEERDDCECQWQCGGVREVVANRTDSRVQQIPEHGDVWRQ